MTRVTNAVYNERCYLEANGHAKGEAEYSDAEDESAVCAAISILMLSAASRFSEMESNGDFVSSFITLEDGYALFDVQPRDDARERTEEIMEMLMCGLYMLEENYPQLIQIS